MVDNNIVQVQSKLVQKEYEPLEIIIHMISIPLSASLGGNTGLTAAALVGSIGPLLTHRLFLWFKKLDSVEASRLILQSTIETSLPGALIWTLVGIPGASVFLASAFVASILKSMLEGRNIVIGMLEDVADSFVNTFSAAIQILNLDPASVKNQVIFLMGMLVVIFASSLIKA